MKDDEQGRPHLPLMVAAAILLVLAGAYLLYRRTAEEARRHHAFCNATHGGELFEHVRTRAAKNEYVVTQQSLTGVEPQEWIISHDFTSYRAGCLVTVGKGRVLKTRWEELPKER